jgi:hypothetical protein
MARDSVDETVLVRYLLGGLPEDEQVRVEERAFSDREYLDIIEAVEADLIDAYVRGELSASDRQQFERRFLASRERRTKVEFARALADVAPGSRGTVFLRRPITAVRFALAAAAVLLVSALSWQTISTIALNRRVAQLEAQRRDQQNREQALTRTLGEEHARADTLAAQLQSATHGVAAIASLVLVPGVSRGEARREILVLPASAQLARIDIRLEPKDEAAPFRAELRTRSGTAILVLHNLRPRPSPTGPAVVVDIPASVLDTADYELRLQGVLDGKPVDIAYCYFSVQKQ